MGAAIIEVPEGSHSIALSQPDQVTGVMMQTPGLTVIAKRLLPHHPSVWLKLPRRPTSPYHQWSRSDWRRFSPITNTRAAA